MLSGDQLVTRTPVIPVGERLRSGADVVRILLTLLASELEFLGALGGIRTPNLLIRRSGRA
jgi:hypothetical protein